MALQEMSVKLYTTLHSKFGGAGNLVNRELTGASLTHLLYSLIIDFPVIKEALGTPHNPIFHRQEDVLNELKFFVEGHLYTSETALRKYFPNHADALVAQFKLPLGVGWEVPEQDMPYDCQHEILGLLLSVEERHGFEFHCRVDKERLDQKSIYLAKLFEMSSENRGYFFFTDECIAYLRERNPDFDSEEYYQTMMEASAIRNHYVHRHLVTTEYISSAILTVIKLIRILGQGPSPDDEPLRIAWQDLRGWSGWSDDNKEQDLDELRSINAGIQQDIHGNKPAGPLSSSLIINAQKDLWGNRVLNLWKDDRSEMGPRLAKHMRRVFKKKTTENFIYPMDRVSLRAAFSVQVMTPNAPAPSAAPTAALPAPATEAAPSTTPSAARAAPTAPTTAAKTELHEEVRSEQDIGGSEDKESDSKHSRDNTTAEGDDEHLVKLRKLDNEGSKDKESDLKRSRDEATAEGGEEHPVKLRKLDNEGHATRLLAPLAGSDQDNPQELTPPITPLPSFTPTSIFDEQIATAGTRSRRNSV